MRTFKFLAHGARGPFSGRAWPAVGDWILTDGALKLASNGVHVCRAGDLAHWLHEELWETEVGGAILTSEDCVVAERARLVRRIAGWNADGMRRFGEACVARAETTGSGYGGDARLVLEHGYVAVAAFSAAMAGATSGSTLRDERSWQSAWIEKEFLADL